MMTRYLCLAFAITLLVMSSVQAITETVELDDYTIDFSYDEDEAEAGERVRIEATVTNEAGETRTDIELELNLDDPFERDGDDEKEIGDLNDGESKTVSFRVEIDNDADDDEYDIEFEIRDNEDDEEDEFPFEVINNKAELIIGSIQSVPTLITPDTEDIRLSITIENIGEEDADAIRLKLDLPEGITASGSFTDIANLGTIEVGDNKEVTFFIDTAEQMASGNLQAAVEFEYESSNDDVRDRETFDIPVKGRPQFNVVSAITDPLKIVAGSEGNVRIQVRNIGEETAHETSIRVFENSDLPVEFNEKTSYIGDITKGNTGTGIISFNVDGDARSNDYLVKVQVRSVSEGNVLVEEYTVTIPITEKEGFDPRIIVLILTIVIIIALFVAVWKTTNKRR